MNPTGTRQRQTTLTRHPDQGAETRFHASDKGMSKYASASITFANTGSLSAANGTFASFAVNDELIVEGTNKNNGFFTVTGIDGANHAFLVTDPSPEAEGPLTATVRTV
jgi:hypothetical protein